LREFSSKNSELIFYERKENSHQRWSDYFIYHVSEPKRFIRFLRQALRVRVVIDKKRTILRYRNAKIHLDKVVALGNFIEIEVEVKTGQVQAKRLMRELLEYLRIPKRDFIRKSYSDLLLRKL